MMKRKLLVPILAALLCMSVIGVGFATWVISTEVEKTPTAAAKFTAYDVETLLVNHTTTFSDSSVVFGSDGGTYDHDWLQADGTDGKEDLTASLSIKIDNAANLTGKRFTLAISAVTVTGVSDFATTYGSYVTLPTAQTITVALDDNGNATLTKDGVSLASNADYNYDKSTNTLTVKLHFGWGSAFNGQNPNKFYNSQAYIEQLGQAAQTALKAVYGLNTKSFNVTVTSKLIVD